ncbi:MAG: NADH-quinone oxidoreductase subunit J [Gammaproteobacteria bacterium]|nr:NADH-quinone oxidoreductase subunit J [Gammaproteobacteria bacterium]
MIEQIVFYAFAAILIVAATMVITVRNPVHAVLFLVLAFFASAGIWMLLEAEFLAIALVLVYVGAVMVLFLFVVMMLDINIAVLREGFARYVPLALVVAILMVGAIGVTVGPANFGADKVAIPAPHAADYSNSQALGAAIYTDYLFPFEIAAVVLLVAIIAAIALTLRTSRQHKQPKTEMQLRARRADRVRLVKVSGTVEQQD